MSDTKQFSVLAFGELLWDELPTESVLGGAPGNFCFRLAELGVPAYLVSKVGKDPKGEEALALIRAAGVNAELVQVDEAYPTGTVNVELDPKGNASFTIIEGVAYDHIELTEPLKERARKASVIYFGTLAQRCAASRDTLRSLIECNSQGLKFFDINLRKNCFSRETIEQSLRVCTVAKLNHEELYTLAEFFALSGSSIDSLAESLAHKFDISVVVITIAERGAFAFSSKGERAYVPGYSVEVVDTIGSGDAFSAAFCRTLLYGGGVAEACELGNRLGALVAQTKGAMTSIRAEDLAAFGRGVARIAEPTLASFA